MSLLSLPLGHFERSPMVSGSMQPQVGRTGVSKNRNSYSSVSYSIAGMESGRDFERSAINAVRRFLACRRGLSRYFAMNPGGRSR
jgi:hypothetical protein